MKSVRVYGIKNCDTVKKALKYLGEKDYGVVFFDYKKELPAKEKINVWFEVLKDYPVNKKGTTYRKVGEEFEALNSHDKKLQFIIDNPSMIIRPIVEDENGLVVLAIGKLFEKL